MKSSSSEELIPNLEITQEAIGPRRTHLVTDYIASVMLWPDDAEKRARAMKTSVAQHIRGTLTAIDGVPAPGSPPPCAMSCT